MANKIKISLKSPKIVTITDVISTKTCTQCDRTKSMTEFYFRGGKCKECMTSNQRQRNKINKAKDILQKTNPNAKSTMKLCCNCKLSKSILLFRITRNECIDCEKQFGRNYNQINKHVRDKWVTENNDKMKQLQADWYRKNKDHINAKYNARYHSDSEFKLKKMLQRHLQLKLKKSKPTESYLGTRIPLIKQWLQYCFDEIMTWENHGTYWEIDHVIPINQFNLSDEKEIEICFNWKNLMPLKSYENNSKSDKIITSQIDIHREKLRNFFLINEINENLDEYLTNYALKLESISETP